MYVYLNRVPCNFNVHPSQRQVESPSRKQPRRVSNGRRLAGSGVRALHQHHVAHHLPGGEIDTKIFQENLEKLKTALGVYEAHLSRFKYLAGDFVSLADICHFPTAYYLLGGSHVSVLDAYPRVKASVAEVMDRPSVKKVVELMKLPSA